MNTSEQSADKGMFMVGRPGEYNGALYLQEQRPMTMWV